MTYDEYKELVKEYRETDSIKRRDEIRGMIFSESKALCETIEKLHNKWGFEFVDDSDYQIGKGGYSLHDFDSTEVNITYSDHWRYGGECCIGISVPMKYLDVDERMKLEDELKAKRVAALRNSYRCNLDSIENIKQQNVEILEKLKGFGVDLENE